VVCRRPGYRYSILISVFCLELLSAQDFIQLSNGAIKQVEVKIETFLGNAQRNYYGNDAPAALRIHWKRYLGKGKTMVSKKVGEKLWAGSGWTGQPLLVYEDGHPFLIQGAFDHKLKKIDALLGNICWQYEFDDVIKGTGTIWLNRKATNLEESIVILQGSRYGYGIEFYKRNIPSYRAISYFSGKEIWRMNVRQTASYSRDVDGSAVILNDTAYIGLENGIFVIFNPAPAAVTKIDRMLQPQLYKEVQLFERQDISRHGGNLVIESSPSVFNQHVYLTSGTGHVYGYNLQTGIVDWDYYIGADLNGSPVVTADSCLLVTIEKQYIAGYGGVLKLDPRREPSQAAVWFFPTGNDTLESWAGGVIGSAGINDQTKISTDQNLCAFSGIDGYLYVVNYRELDHTQGKIPGPDLKGSYSQPRLVFKKELYPSISTPIIVGRKLIAAGYGGLYLFEYDAELNFKLLAKWINSAFESTPIVFDRKIYIGARDGYLYCFGD
jgi:outer membrane protein assembly factor BamB